MTEDVRDSDGMVVIVVFLGVLVGVGGIVIEDISVGGPVVVDGGWNVVVDVDP